MQSFFYFQRNLTGGKKKEKPKTFPFSF